MKNNILYGALIGVFAPLLAFILIRYTDIQSTFLPDKPVALFVIAAAINLIILRFSYRAGNDAFARGVLLMTFVAMIILIFGSRFDI